jgi:aldehyde:ferredoxin oxidoreductase
MECFEEGLLTLADTGGIDLRWGNGESVVKMVELIAKREGIGDLLAEGVLRAAEKIGKGAERYAIHWRGQELPMHDPRFKGTIGLAYSASPIGADHCVAEHDSDFTFDSPQVWMDLASPLGVLRRLPTSTLDNPKIRNFYLLQQNFSMQDTLCICIFDHAPVRHFKVHELVEAAQATTGWELSAYELMKAGERRINMFRVFNLREESPLDRYWLPERMFEPLKSGPTAGLKVERDTLRTALAKYFEMLNWDEGAVPREMKLVELDLEWLEPIAREYRGKLRDVIGLPAEAAGATA